MATPAPVGTPNSLGYVNPFAPTPTEPPASVTDPLKASYNNIVSGINSYKSPPQEPAVISSTGADTQIKNAQDKMAQMSDKGTKVDPTTGATTYADNSAVAAPPGSVYNEKTGLYEAADGKSYGAADFYGQGTNPDGSPKTPDPDFVAIDNMFAPLKASLDANTLAQVNAIQQSYEGLKAKQQQINDMSSRALSTKLLRTGAAQYAPATASGMHLANLTVGLNAIADLDAKENSAIASAKAAQESGDYKYMTDEMTRAESIRKEKQDTAQKVMDGVQKANDALIAQREQIMKDEAVAQEMAKGTMDPQQIMQNINAAGGSVTAKDVADAIKNLTPTSTGTFKFSQADIGKMLGAGMTSAQIQATQDYYNSNGKGTMPTLTAEQTAAVQKALTGITPKAPKSPSTVKPFIDGTLTYTPEDHAADSQALDASRGADGFVDPTLYQKLYTAWIGKGGTAEGFIKTFPPKNYVNPANDWLPTYLRPKPPAASGGITPAEIDALFASPK